MTSKASNIFFPTARVIGGSLYEPQTKDADGNQLTIKNGPDAGKATQRYDFGIAIPKAPGQQHWASQPAGWNLVDGKGQPIAYWGATMWATGHAAFPQQAQRPDFAWKVTDGDSQIPNKKGRKPCEREGYPGHWVVWLSSSFAPRIFNSNGSAPITEPNAIKPGFYVQVSGTVVGNDSNQNPGLFVNHNMVALQGYGPEIISGPDPTAVGFGGGAAPVGMSATPVGGMAAPPPAAAPVAAPAGAPPPPAAAAPGTPPPPPGAPPPAAPPPTAVVPHTAILQPQTAPPPPAAAPPPPAAPAPAADPVLTAKAAGATYAQFKANGWTDDALRQHGYLA